jgi:uncharacterized protein
MFGFTAFIYPQDSTGSLAFRNNRPEKKRTIFYQPDLSYRIWQQFNLVREANSGNPLAQHELGLRYLIGEDQTADTSKAVVWIRKAALQNLPAAAFNYGILLFNGWGTDWNPFEAYKNFLIAAKDSMPQAMYIIGILHTDNLIVKRDWGKAYFNIKAAADKGYKPASDALPEIRKQLPENFDTSGIVKSYPGSTNTETPGLLFIDFDRPVAKTSDDLPDSLLFSDLLLSGNKNFEEIVIQKDSAIEINFDENKLRILEESAGWGCPEALTLLGRFYEKGDYVHQDLITAASYYIRGARYDSYKSKLFLLNLVKNPEFLEQLKNSALAKDPEAMFAWYGLFDFGLDKSITVKDAINMLATSAGKDYYPAVSELGLLHYTGKYVTKDPGKSILLWSGAAGKGYNEASLRISASVIYGESQGDFNKSKEGIYSGNEMGSLLAQVALAYLKEKENKISESVRLYRSAAQRGNRFAFDMLEKRYNEIRPPDKQFSID